MRLSSSNIKKFPETETPKEIPYNIKKFPGTEIPKEIPYISPNGTF